jgi:hypothetical protein
MAREQIRDLLNFVYFLITLQPSHSGSESLIHRLQPFSNPLFCVAKCFCIYSSFFNHKNCSNWKSSSNICITQICIYLPCMLKSASILRSYILLIKNSNDIIKLFWNKKMF